jgi:ATP-binding cassette subfamily B (MDR/TAP) protein 9
VIDHTKLRDVSFQKEALVYGGYTWCNHVLEMITDVLTLYYGGHLVMRGELSGGNLVSFLLYSLSLGTAIEEIGDVYTGLVDAVGAAEKVCNV